MRTSSLLLGLVTSAALLHTPSSARADTVDANTVVRGRYVLVLHPTTVNRVAISTDNDLAVPVAVAVRGKTIAFGGKRGPQLVGTVVGGHVTATRPGPSPTLGQMSIDGSMDGMNAMSGTFTMTTPKGNKVSGTFVGSPYGVGWGSGVLGGSVKTPTGGSLPTNGTSGSVKTPTGGKFAGPSDTGSLGAIHGGHGPTVHWQSGSAVLEPASGSAPGQAGAGPNLTTTSAGGAASEDPKKGDAAGDAAANDSNSLSNAVKGLDILNPKGDDGSAKAPTAAKAPKQGDGSQAQSGTSLWDTLFGTTNNNPSPVTPVKPVRHGSGGSVDERQTYGGNDKQNKGAGGRGGSDGPGSTDRGSSGSGGQNAQGQYQAVHRTSGDNPFEVVGDDVLNTQHLVNPAADPMFGPGAGAIRH